MASQPEQRGDGRSAVVTLRASASPQAQRRRALVRRSTRLNLLTLAYNVIEACVSLAAGLVAGSVALIGFGIDSGVEVTAGMAALVRLRVDGDLEARALASVEGG